MALTIPAATVSVHAVSGSGQRETAFAAATMPGYVAAFARPLIVRITGFKERDPSVRYTCVSPRCRFALSTQPDEVKRIDVRTYEVRAKKGTASIELTLSTDTVPGAFVIVVQPVLHAHERKGSVARFRLTVR